MDGCRNRGSAAIVRLPGTAYVPTGTEVTAMRTSPLRQASLYAMLLALACSHTPRLVPAPEAQRLSDDPGAAVASGAGVQVTIRSRSWQGEPRDLESIVTPVQRDRGERLGGRHPDPVPLLHYPGFPLWDG